MDYNQFQEISQTGIKAFHFTFASSTYQNNTINHRTTNSNIMNTYHNTSDPNSTTKGAENPL